jgi:hypothetical protein
MKEELKLLTGLLERRGVIVRSHLQYPHTRQIPVLNRLSDEHCREDHAGDSQAN